MATTRLERVDVIKDLLARWGYTDAHLEQDFPLNVSLGNQIRVDIAAFGDAFQHDTSTSSIIVHTSVPTEAEFHQVQTAAAIVGAPLALLGYRDRLAVWSVAHEPDRAMKLEEASFSDLTPLYERTSEFGLEALTRFKDKGSQPTLFPIDVNLLDFARKKSRAYLIQTVETLVARASSLLGAQDPKLVMRIAIGAIAVIMLRDKGLVDRSLEGGGLLDATTTRFPSYLGWVNDLPPRRLSVFDTAVAELGQSLSFAGLEPHMVSDVYEEALVSQAQRRVQGTFFTPPPLARQILRAIPLERLSPEQRHVLDPACGSGTMLLAAAERLRAADLPHLDSGFDPIQLHEYVTGHLRGFDKDYFATEVSKLALLLAALPIGNSWQVEAKDLFRINPKEVDGTAVILSNPPWQHVRAEGQRVETASRFLAWMLEALDPGGYIACVLPQSWLDARSNRGSRRDFFSKVELLDLWRLPTEVFPQTSEAIAPIVVVANKRKMKQERPTLVKAVNSEDALRTFYDTGRAGTTFLAISGDEGQGLLTGQVRQYLSKRADLTLSVGDIARVRNGRPHRPRRLRRTPSEATHWEVSSLNDLPAFGQAVARLPVVFPDDFDNTRLPWLQYAEGDKLLVTAKRWSARDPWRFKVGLDRMGYVPRELFHVVRPIFDSEGWRGLPEDRQLLALLALLGSGLANCWVDDLTPGRNLSPRTFDSFPIPGSREGLDTLAILGEELVRVGEDGGDIASVCRRLEVAVADIYDLPVYVQGAIEARLGGQPAPEGGIRYPSVPRASNGEFGDGVFLPSFGEVLDIDLDRGLHLWVSGITDDEGVWIGLPDRAFGWLISAGTDFVVEGNLDDLAASSFSLHKSEWLMPSSVDSTEA